MGGEGRGPVRGHGLMSSPIKYLSPVLQPGRQGGLYVRLSYALSILMGAEAVFALAAGGAPAAPVTNRTVDGLEAEVIPLPCEVRSHAQP
jgi:hypothetical protein